MVVLSSETLKSILHVTEEDLDCSGIKLHLDKIYGFVEQGGVYSSSKRFPKTFEIQPNEYGVYLLKPGGYKIRYKEVVKIPENTIALAIPRSTLLRIGATIYTAVWDPGYEGRGEGLMVVFNHQGIEIEHGIQVAQLVFISLDRVTKYVYRGSYFRENLDQ